MKTKTRAARTLAQHYCRLVGAVLALIGVLGFIADATFDTGADVQGDSLFGFEVNGWHNLVHLASGIVLLAAANTRPTAKTVAIGFGFVYLLVALWGLVDGEQVMGVLPVNGADNVLHLLLAGLGIGLGMASPGTKGEQLRRREKGRGQEPPVRRDAAAGTSDAGGASEPGTAAGGTGTPAGEAEGLKAQNEVTRTRS